MCGRKGTPYTTPLPAFHPLSGHARSRSISAPRRILSLNSLPQINPCLFARSRVISAIDVGTTQLTVSGTHGQPYFVGSNRTCRSENRNLKRTSHEASSGRQRSNASSEAASVPGAVRKIISALAAIAVAQKFPPAAPSPTAGPNPFGNWRAINGARSSAVAVERDGDEYRASSASEVGSAPNCPPHWLHPPAPESRRRWSSASSRHRTNRGLSNPTNEMLMLPEFLPLRLRPCLEPPRRGLSFRFSPEPTTRQKVLGVGICVPIPQTSSAQRQRVGGRRKVSPDFAGCESCRTIAPWQGRRLSKVRNRLRPRFQRLPISCRGRSFRKTVDEGL